jgi:hypothetical protein
MPTTYPAPGAAPVRASQSHNRRAGAEGAALEDPAGLFNSSLEGRVRRAIDIREGDELDEAALKDLVRAAVALNTGG